MSRYDPQRDPVIRAIWRITLAIISIAVALLSAAAVVGFVGLALMMFREIY